MKTLVITLLAAMTAWTLFSAAVQGEDDEEKVIRDTIQLYFQGDRDREVESLKKAFHPTARLGTADEAGRLHVLTQSEWHERVRRTPDREKPEASILHIDRAGNAAMAKTQMILSNGQYTDYLSLLKIDGRWIIVNKIYHWEER